MYDQHLCDSSNLVLDRQTGDLICSACGFVVQEHMIDERAPWRNHEDGEDKATAGGPLSVRDQLLDDGGLPVTGISSGRWNSRQDASTNSKKQNVAASLSQTHRRASRPSKSNRIHKALDELSEIITRLGLPNSIENTAMTLFDKFVKVSPTRKKNLQPYVAASVYLACRQTGATRAVREIATATGIDPKELGRKFKEMMRLLESDMAVVKSTDFMNRYCQHLELTQQTTSFCTHVVHMTMKSGVAEGKSPISIAAAAIFMVTQLNDEKRTEKQVMDVTQVSEPTLRAVYKLLREHKDQLLPDALREPAAHHNPHHSPDLSPTSSPRSYSGSALSPAALVLASPDSLSPSPPSSPASGKTTSANSSLAVESPQPRPVLVPAPPAITLTAVQDEQLDLAALEQQQHDNLDYLLSTPATLLSAMTPVPELFGVDPAIVAPSTVFYPPSLLETAAYGLYQEHA